jgi:hypothetical protein
LRVRCRRSARNEHRERHCDACFRECHGLSSWFFGFRGALSTIAAFIHMKNCFMGIDISSF